MDCGVSKNGKTSVKTKLLMFFMKIRFNVPFVFLSHVFGLDKGTVSSHFKEVMRSYLLSHVTAVTYHDTCDKKYIN